MHFESVLFSSTNPSDRIIAPAMLAAAYYILLGRIIKAFGPQYCRFDTKTYSIVFVCGDVLGLVIQAAGGAMASMAKNKEDTDTGTTIMVMSVYCGASFCFRIFRADEVGQWCLCSNDCHDAVQHGAY